MFGRKYIAKKSVPILGLTVLYKSVFHKLLGSKISAKMSTKRSIRQIGSPAAAAAFLNDQVKTLRKPTNQQNPNQTKILPSIITITF